MGGPEFWVRTYNNPLIKESLSSSMMHWLMGCHRTIDALIAEVRPHIVVAHVDTGLLTNCGICVPTLPQKSWGMLNAVYLFSKPLEILVGPYLRGRAFKAV